MDIIRDKTEIAKDLGISRENANNISLMIDAEASNKRMEKGATRKRELVFSDENIMQVITEYDEVKSVPLIPKGTIQGNQTGTICPKSLSDSIQSLIKQTLKIEGNFERIPVCNIYPPFQCHFNVLERKKRFPKTQIISGWRIVEIPNEVVIAQFHSVTLKNGKLLDVTTNIDGEEETLFIADPITKYIPDEGIVPNWMFPLNGDIPYRDMGRRIEGNNVRTDDLQVFMSLKNFNL